MTEQPSNPVDPEDVVDDVPEQIRVRREKRQRLLDSGQQAYPVRVPVTHTIAQVREAHPDLPADTATGETVSIAGRVIFVRNTGKLCFATLQDSFTADACVRAFHLGSTRIYRSNDLLGRPAVFYADRASRPAQLNL